MSERQRAVVLGLCLAWFLGFLRPTLLNAQRVMAFPEYVPRASRVGSDLRWALEKCRRISPTKLSPYTPGERLTISYPPAGMLALLPLSLLGDDRAYLLVSVATVVAFACLVLVVPRVLGHHSRELSWLVFCGGLFSYGLHFELERGALNVVATALALGGVALQRSATTRKGRLAACLLFSIGGQLKIYPFAYGLALVRDFRDWRGNLRLAGLLLLINVPLLFVLGTDATRAFLLCVAEQAFAPYLWEGNLSAVSFEAWSGVPARLTLFLLFACAGWTLVQAVRLRLGGTEPFLLAAITGLVLVLPGTSHDYKLPLLAPVAVMTLAAVGTLRHERAAVLLAFALSFAYHLTLFSYTNRRPLLENATPLVLAFCILSTIAAALLGGPGLNRASDDGSRPAAPR